MGVTISTHNGSAVSREHNIRNPKVVSKEPHIDMNGSHEVWIDEPVRKAYDRLFGEAVEAYNAKQARPERQIKSYYNDICKDSKKHPVYEMIIGIYGKNEDGSPICSAEQGKEIMRQFVDNWQERNPNLELIGAYFHADEPGAEPHVHLDYIPVAHGYTRGLETQTGLVKALGEQGFEKKGKATAQIQWEKCENDYLTSLCEAVGLRVEHPRQEGRQHLATQEMKLQSRINELEKVAEQEAARFLEADAKATDAEMRAAAAEKRAAKAEHKLDEVNAKVEIATQEVKTALDKAAKASEITSLSSMLHRVGQHKNTVTYNENMLDSTRAIGYEASEHLKKANQTKQEAVAIQQRAEAKEKAIDPLYQQASEAHRQAQAELSRAKKISEQSEQLIEQKAEARASEMVREIMQGTPTRERDRMRKYMDSLQFKDGTTALEQFEEQERQLQRKLNRGLQR
ncbi:MAG: plasmid recombination protein [Clostridia bacterium]|nr:plasmid recombination protein [Clostridia bacterium]